MPFIDREKELAFLEGLWREPGSQLVVLWGKRRVGKTELVKQFLQDKPHVYFLSESTSDREQLHRFSQALGRFFREPSWKRGALLGGRRVLRMSAARSNALFWPSTNSPTSWARTRP